MSNKNEIILKVAGKAFRGWTSVVVEKSLYQITGAFGLSATDIFPGNMQKWGFVLGDECVIEINGQTIITGYIEDLPITYSNDSHNIQIGGRDKTGDLVDCSFIESRNAWTDQTVLHIITALCSPFSIDIAVDDSVTTQVKTKVVGEFRADEGDVIFDLIIKLCRSVAILPVSYGDGKLTLTRAGIEYKAHDTLELGVNVKSGSIDQSNKDRFRTYIVKGQGEGTDEKTLWDIIEPVAPPYVDEIIMRYRPIVIFSERKCDTGQCIVRAEWEARNRAGKSRNLEYEVQGWTQSNGDVWPLNAMVSVKDSFLGINNSLLIAAVSFSLDSSFGMITRLSLVDPKAFNILAEPITDMGTGADLW